MLPHTFRPKKEYDLARIGKDNDGGYLVERKSLDQAHVLLSFGVNTDWSFEEHFQQHKAEQNQPSLIHAYDGTIDHQVLRAHDRKHRTTLAPQFTAFFDNKPNQFFCQMIGDTEGFTSVKEALERAAHAGGHHVATDTSATDTSATDTGASVMISCDIEGAEYSILDELIECQDQMAGLLLEVHSLHVSENVQKIQRFIEQFSLVLVHVHANNYSPISLDGIPFVLELSFARDPVPIGENSLIPHPLDQPNVLIAPDFSPVFALEGSTVREEVSQRVHVLPCGLVDHLNIEKKERTLHARLDYRGLRLFAKLTRTGAHRQGNHTVAVVPLCQALLTKSIATFALFQRARATVGPAGKCTMMVVEPPHSDQKQKNAVAKAATQHDIALEWITVDPSKSKNRRRMILIKRLNALGTTTLVNVDHLLVDHKLALSLGNTHAVHLKQHAPISLAAQRDAPILSVITAFQDLEAGTSFAIFTHAEQQITVPLHEARDPEMDKFAMSPTARDTIIEWVLGIDGAVPSDE